MILSQSQVNLEIYHNSLRPLLTRPLTGQLVGIAQRSVLVKYDDSKGRYSSRKLT